MIRVVLAAESDLMLFALKHVIENEYRYKVDAVTRSGSQLLSILTAPPDIIVIHEGLHHVDLLTLVEQIKAQHGRTRIVVIGNQKHGILIYELFHAGINAYLCQGDMLCDKLATALDYVMLRRPYLSPTANTEYLLAMHELRKREPLSKHMREVLSLLAEGEQISEIATKLRLNMRRVYWIRQKLKTYFLARTNEHLIHRAHTEGFLYTRE